MLRNKLMTACSVALLTAALYGCSSSSDDGANMKVQNLEDQFAALSAELGEGEELTPEALAALIQAKVDAEAALTDAMVAHGEALRLAGEMAEAGQAEALRLAMVDADAALKLVQDELDALEIQAAHIVAGNEAKAKSEMAAEVLTALETLSGTAPVITLKASSAGNLTAETASYTMSDTAPDAISGFRGAILTKGGAEAHVYTDIEDAAATPIRRLYRSASDPAELTVHYNVREALLVTGEKDILWEDANRDDTAENAVGVGSDRVTTFAGSVRGLPPARSLAWELLAWSRSATAMVRL